MNEQRQEERANEAILVLAHRIKPKDQWREAVIAARRLCASVDLPDMKKPSSVGDWKPILAAWPD